MSMHGSAGPLSLAALLSALAGCSHGPASMSSLSLRPPADARVSPTRIIETQANTFTSSAQQHVAVDVDDSGCAVAAWESRRQNEGRPGVYARLFDGLGRAITPEIALGDGDRQFQTRPAVAFASDGAIWAAWSAYGPDGSGSGIIARRFDSYLCAAGPAIGVNQQREGDQSGVSLAAGPDGSALIAWTNFSDSQRPVIAARAYSASGQPMGDEITLAAEPGLRNSTPVLAAAGDGYLAVWARADAEGRPAGLVARRLDATGRASGPEFAVTETGDPGIEPAIAADRAGRFTIAWMSPAGDDYTVRARAFDAAGVPAGPAVDVSGGAPSMRSGVAVALAEDGAATIIFNTFEIREQPDGSMDGGNDLYRVDADLFADFPRAGPARLVREDAEGDQALTIASGARRIAAGRDGRLAIGWSGRGPGADSSAANLTLVVPEPVASAAELRPAPAMIAAAREQEPGGAEPHIPPTFDPNWKPQEPAIIAREDDTDFGFEAVPGTGWTPPDPEMAVGTGHVVAIVNGQIAFFDKSGANLFRDEIEGATGFWGPVGAGGFVFDPEALYDASTNRFMVMACERTGGQSFFLYAVSDDANPVGTWHKYRFNVTALGGNDIDSPNFAFDATSITLTADFFAPDDFLVFTVDKAAVLAGLPSPATRSLLVTGSHSYGVPPMNSPAPAQYLIQSFEASSNTAVRFHAVRNPLTTPTRVTFDLTVPEYRFPTPPTQQGTSSRPTLFEPRFWSCSYRNGSLWAVHHITTAAVTSRTRVRWYEFRMNGWPASGTNPSLAQWGEIDAGVSNHAYFPSIDANDAGDAAITYARSGPTEFISMWRAVRRHTDAPGTMRAQTLVRASTTPFTAATRWGDYSATRPDPANPCRFWGHHEWTTSSSSWRTWVASYDNFATIDFNKDCEVDFADYLEFLNLYNAQDPRADLNGDGFVDFADYLEFLNQYDLG
ncbi:MAG: hypothetical protein IT436_12965 [Phycisphaerales bacterium]|nr:hypothetical protein [Phycisphaerales bacterium]